MKSIDELVEELAQRQEVKQTVKPKLAPKTENKAIPKKTVNAEVTASVPEAPKQCKCGGCKSNSPEKLTIAMAKEVALAVEKAAEILGIKVVVSICDEGANLILLHAMDDSYIASVKLSQEKAYTSVALKMPTHTALEESRGGSLDGLTNGNGIMLLGGGSPLKANNKIYGAIGVSGGTKDEDTILAMVAGEYFKARFE